MELLFIYYVSFKCYIEIELCIINGQRSEVIGG